MNLSSRIAALESRRDPAAPMLIVVSGGLEGEPRSATIGGQRFERGPDEAPDAFHSRCLSAAAGAGECFAVVGGLAE